MVRARRLRGLIDMERLVAHRHTDRAGTQPGFRGWLLLFRERSSAVQSKRHIDAIGVSLGCRAHRPCCLTRPPDENRGVRWWLVLVSRAMRTAFYLVAAAAFVCSITLLLVRYRQAQAEEAAWDTGLDAERRQRDGGDDGGTPGEDPAEAAFKGVRATAVSSTHALTLRATPALRCASGGGGGAAASDKATDPQRVGVFSGRRPRALLERIGLR